MSKSKTTEPLRYLGVGIDTARYGHHVTFLRVDRQPAAKPLIVNESSGGYGSKTRSYNCIGDIPRHTSTSVSMQQGNTQTTCCDSCVTRSNGNL